MLASESNVRAEITSNTAAVDKAEEEHEEVTRLYIHALERDGDTRDFGLVGNEASDITQWLP